jgi:hypothetical protein
MRSRTRELYPQEILFQSNRMDTAYNRIDWLQVYQPLNAGEEQRLLLQHGTGPLIVAQNTWRVSTKRAMNRIEALAGNVQTMRFYFNDQMADFDRAVTIVVNRKVQFEGFLKPSVDEMLKDQLFVGRGWRYFTAVVDIDLVPAPPTTTRPSPAR